MPLSVLFYEDPLTDHHAFGWRAPHVQLDAPWLASLMASGCRVAMLVHGRFAHVALEAGVPYDVLMVVSEDSVRRLLPNPQFDVNTLFHGHYGALTGIDPITDHSLELDTALAIRDRFANLVESLIVGFDPDVIITWVPAPHLRRISNALILHKETGMYARSPQPTSYFLDPLGLHRWSVPRRKGAVRAAEAARVAFSGLKRTLNCAMRETDHWPTFEDDHASATGTIFVPAQMSGGFLYDGASAYRSQTHMILDVLERVPKDWTVIANDHPDCPRLSPWEQEYVAALHPNFHYRVNAVYAEGQHIARQVDAIATVSSSLGLQGLIWDKTIVALGDSHIGAFSELGPDDLPALTRASRDGSDAAAWLSFHYCYPNLYAGRPGWLADHLRLRVEQWKQDGAAGFFDAPFDAPADIAAFLGSHIESEVSKTYAERARARAAASVPSHTAALEVELDARTADLVETRRLLVERSEVASKLHADLIASRSAYDDLQNLVVARTDVATTLNEHLIATRAELVDLRSVLVSRTAAAETLMTDLHEARRQLAELQVPSGTD